MKAAMEKQKSFSVKPIKVLVSSFTLSFSVIFVIFCFSWVFKSPPLIHLGAQNLGVQSSKGFSNTSSEHELKNSILTERNYVGDGNSSSQTVGGVADTEGFKREGGASAVTDAASKGSLLTANSSFTPLGNVSDSTKPNMEVVNIENLDEKDQELNAVETVEVAMENNSSEREVRTSDVSSEKEQSSIRSSVEDKNRIDCDVTIGNWVFDESYPLYTNATCPFIDEGFSCESNGRLDKDYMKWRWQPQDCSIPRFNATKMLELIRGKRLVFVGDSLNRNQWESMLCLLMGGVKDPKKVYEARGRKITKERGNYCFKFEDYKCTVEYYVSHYLVHESKARIGKKKGQTLRIDAIDKGSSRWRGADIIVFNTAHWWNHQKTKAGNNYYQEGNQLHPHLHVTTAFKRALLTWASWVDKNINPRKTQIFFRSSSPAHFSGGQWDNGGHCKEAFRPVNETFTSTYPEKNLIMEEVLRQMKIPVIFLNITRLSDYRPDAHPSIYGRKAINPSVEDCSHWCLPGVPDVWNELMYYHLHSRSKAIL